MKRISPIVIFLMFVAIPITIQAKTLHYIPTPEQLQPAPAGTAPNISHNVNFVSPANPFVEYGTTTAAGQPAASPSPNAKNISGGAIPVAASQGSGAVNRWTVFLLLFAGLLALALIILKKRDDKK